MADAGGAAGGDDDSHSHDTHDEAALIALLEQRRDSAPQVVPKPPDEASAPSRVTDSLEGTIPAGAVHPAVPAPGAAAFVTLGASSEDDVANEIAAAAGGPPGSVARLAVSIGSDAAGGDESPAPAESPREYPPTPPPGGVQPSGRHQLLSPVSEGQYEDVGEEKGAAAGLRPLSVQQQGATPVVQLLRSVGHRTSSAGSGSSVGTRGRTVEFADPKECTYARDTAHIDSVDDGGLPLGLAGLPTDRSVDSDRPTAGARRGQCDTSDSSAGREPTVATATDSPRRLTTATDSPTGAAAGAAASAGGRAPSAPPVGPAPELAVQPPRQSSRSSSSPPRAASAADGGSHDALPVPRKVGTLGRLKGTLGRKPGSGAALRRPAAAAGRTPPSPSAELSADLPGGEKRGSVLMGGSTGRQMRKVPSVSGTEFVSGPIQVETKGLLGASLKSRWVVLKGRWLEEYASERKAGGAGRPLRSIDIFCAHQRDGPEAVDIEIVGPNLPPPGVLRLRADAASSARWRRGIGAALSSVHCSPDARSDSPSCLKGAKREDDDEEREAPEASYERRRAERVDWLGAGLEEFYAWKDPAKVGKNTARLADSHVFEEFKLYVRMAVKYPDARESGKLDWLLEPPESTVSDPRHAEIGCGIDLEALVEHERRVTALETKMRAFYMAHARERVGQERTVALVFVGREGELAKVMAKHHADATEHLGFLSSDEVPFNKRAGAGSPASLLVQSLSHTREATREGTRSPVRESSPTLDSPSIEKKQSIRWDSSVKGASRPHKAMQPRGGKPAQKQDKGPGALQRLLGKLPGKGARDDDEDDASPDGGNDG